MIPSPAYGEFPAHPVDLTGPRICLQLYPFPLPSLVIRLLHEGQSGGRVITGLASETIRIFSEMTVPLLETANSDYCIARYDLADNLPEILSARYAIHRTARSLSRIVNETCPPVPVFGDL